MLLVSPCTALHLLNTVALGVVWKGKWRKMEVAVKELINVNVSEADIRAFLDEATLMMQMKSHKVHS